MFSLPALPHRCAGSGRLLRLPVLLFVAAVRLLAGSRVIPVLSAVVSRRRLLLPFVLILSAARGLLLLLLLLFLQIFQVEPGVFMFRRRFKDFFITFDRFLYFAAFGQRVAPVVKAFDIAAGKCFNASSKLPAR